MPRIPDLSDPRYLDEVGWFLYRRASTGVTASEAPTTPSGSRTPGSCGTKSPPFWAGTPAGSRARPSSASGAAVPGDLAAFPATVKVAIDPLLYAYQHLDMLVPDEAGGRTLYLSLGAEELPCWIAAADLVICRTPRSCPIPASR